MNHVQIIKDALYHFLVAIYYILYIVRDFMSVNCSPMQKHEESSNNNGPVSIADVENETVVELVDNGVTAILTRLQSEWGEMSTTCI